MLVGDLALQPTLPVTFEPVDDNEAKPLHKPRVVWTDVLHQRFLRAIDAAGSEEAAVPTVILRVRAPLSWHGIDVRCFGRSAVVPATTYTSLSRPLV